MTTNVYAWPPVATVSKEWTVFDPISESTEMFGGAVYVSAVQRRRRKATIEASARFSPYGAGGGYMEALKRLLKGGVHLVRLNHRTRTYYDSLALQNERRGDFFGWIVPPGNVDWTVPPASFDWFAGALLTYTIVEGATFPTLQVSNLPQSKLIALPGEFLTCIAPDGQEFTAMILAPVNSNSSGVALVRIEQEPPFEGRVNFGTFDTGVFKADQMPRSIEPGGGDWSYNWSFTEVFEDERGPFLELNPWN